MSSPGPTGPPPPPYVPDPYIPEHLPVIDEPELIDVDDPPRDPLGVGGLIVVLGTIVYIGVYVWSYWDLFSDNGFGESFETPAVDRLRASASVLNPGVLVNLLVGVALASLRSTLGLTEDGIESVATRAAKTIGGIAGLVVLFGGFIAAVDVAFIRDAGEALFIASDDRWRDAAIHLSAASMGFVCFYLAAWPDQARRTAAFLRPTPSDHDPFGEFD